MKRVMSGSLLLVGLFLIACEKETTVPSFMRERPHGVVAAEFSSMYVQPFRPDTLREPIIPLVPRKPRLAFVPVGPIMYSRCVNSYDELVASIGSNSVQARSVVVDGGPLGDVTISLDPNLAVIIYTAVDNPTGSSLFNSQLIVEWRPDPSVYFQGYTSDVWSKGCVYVHSAPGPFTNLLKGGEIIQINTSFFWPVGDYKGMPIKFIVLD